MHHGQAAPLLPHVHVYSQRNVPAVGDRWQHRRQGARIPRQVAGDGSRHGHRQTGCAGHMVPHSCICRQQARRLGYMPLVGTGGCGGRGGGRPMHLHSSSSSGAVRRGGPGAVVPRRRGGRWRWSSSMSDALPQEGWRKHRCGRRGGFKAKLPRRQQCSMRRQTCSVQISCSAVQLRCFRRVHVAGHVRRRQPVRLRLASQPGSKRQAHRHPRGLHSSRGHRGC